MSQEPDFASQFAALAEPDDFEAQFDAAASPDDTFAQGAARGLLGTWGAMAGQATLGRRVAVDLAKFLGADDDQAQRIDTFLKIAYPANEYFAGQGDKLKGFAAMVPRGTPTLASRVGEAAGSSAVLAPLALGGPLLAGGAAAGMEASEMQKEATRAGASPGLSLAATGIGALIGGSEALGAEQAIGRLGKVFDGAPASLKQNVLAAIIGEMAKSGATEAGTEALQGMGEDAVRDYVIAGGAKPVMDWLSEHAEDWIDQGLAAGVVGMFMGGLVKAGELPIEALQATMRPEDQPQPSAQAAPGGAGAEPEAAALTAEGGLAPTPLDPSVPLLNEQLAKPVQTSTQVGLQTDPRTEVDVQTELPATAQPLVGAGETAAVAGTTNELPIESPVSSFEAQFDAAIAQPEPSTSPESPRELVPGAPAVSAATERRPAVDEVTPTSGDDAATTLRPADMDIREEGPSTGIKNRTVDAELEAMGLPPAEHGAKRSDIEVYEAAKRTFDSDRGSGRRLIDELSTGQRPMTDTEAALATFEVNQRINERDDAEAAYLIDPSEDNLARIERAKADYAQAAEVVTKSGTESGRAFRLRRMMLARDYSLAAMERRAQVANKAQPLSAEESAQIKELHGKIKAAELAAERAQAESAEKIAQLEAENALLKLKKKVARTAKADQRQAKIAKTRTEIDAIVKELATLGMRAHALVDPKVAVLAAKLALKHIELGVRKFEAFVEQATALVGDEIKPYLEEAWKKAQADLRAEVGAKIKARLDKGDSITKQGRLINQIAEQFVADGIADADELIDAVHAVLKDIDSTITREQARDAISGYGQFRELSKRELAAEMRDLKGQMRAMAKLEAALDKADPEKTGFERRKPSEAEQKILDQINAVTKSDKPPRDALKAYKKRLDTEIKFAQERVDYAEIEPSSPKSKRKPLDLDSEATEKKADLTRLKREFAALVEKRRLENRTKLERAKDFARESLDLTKAIKTMWDYSAVLRQGGFFSLAHPIETARQLPIMFRAGFSEQRAIEVMEAIRSRDLYAFAERSGLEMTEFGEALGPHEEALHSRLSDKIPGKKASDRAFTTFLNVQRAMMFDALVRAIPGTPTLEQGKAIANAVNIGTGRGNPGAFAKHMQGIGLFLWSPRLLLSRIQLLVGQPLLHGDMTTRKLIAKEYARSLMGLAAVYTLWGLAGGDEPEKDPRSSDFGKLRDGKTRLDPLAGLAQVTVLLSRLSTGEMKALRSGRTSDADGAEILGRFLRTKLSPVLGTAVNIASGENLVGEKVTPATVARDILIPLSMQDLVNVMQENGISRGLAYSILSTFGMGLQVYE